MKKDFKVINFKLGVYFIINNMVYNFQVKNKRDVKLLKFLFRIACTRLDNNQEKIISFLEKIKKNNFSLDIFSSALDNKLVSIDLERILTGV